MQKHPIWSFEMPSISIRRSRKRFRARCLKSRDCRLVSNEWSKSVTRLFLKGQFMLCTRIVQRYHFRQCCFGETFCSDRLGFFVSEQAAVRSDVMPNRGDMT